MTTRHASTGTKIPETTSQSGAAPWMPQVASQPDLSAVDASHKESGAKGGVTAVNESPSPLVCFAASAGEVSVDAAVLAEALDVAPAELLRRIRTRQISAIHEHGVGEDAGRERLIFYHGNRRVRLLIDAQGAILERVVERVHQRIPRSRRALPALQEPVAPNLPPESTE